MSRNPPQKIAVLTTLTRSDQSLILNGIKVAAIFRKELCLVHHIKKNRKKEENKIRKMLRTKSRAVNREIPGMIISNLVLTGPVSMIPEQLADDYEAILILADASRVRYYSKAIMKSPVPFLFLSQETPVSAFKKIVMPLDIRKENSDSALWCSWFGRFNRAEIVVVAASEKSKEEQKQIAKNGFLTKKLFARFQIPHKIYKGRRSSLGNAFESLELARTSGCDFLVILGSSTITPLDLLVGLPERKIVQMAQDLPVMVINPRRDNYILCD